MTRVSELSVARAPEGVARHAERRAKRGSQGSPIDAASPTLQTKAVRVRLETIFPWSAERAWVEVQEVALLCEVARPLAREIDRRRKHA